MPPETRASFAHNIQEAVSRLPPVQAEVIRNRTGLAWARIEQAPKIAWLDEATYNALTHSIRAVLGDEAAQEVFRNAGRQIVSNQGLQSMLESAVRLFGMSPHSILKIIPRGRQSVVKNSGTLTYQRVGERCACMYLVDFPVSTFKSGTTLLILSGGFLGCLDAMGASVAAEVQTRDIELLAGRATFEVRW